MAIEPIDMSPEAIDRRLKQVEQLRRLCLSLGKAVPVEKTNENEENDINADDQTGEKQCD